MLNNLTPYFQSKLDSTVSLPVNLAVLELDTTTLYFSDLPIIHEINGFEGVEFKDLVSNLTTLDDNVQYETDLIGDDGSLQLRQFQLDLVYNEEFAPLFEDIFRKKIRINKRRLYLYQYFLDSTEAPVLMDIFSCTSAIEYTEKDMLFSIKLDSLPMLSNPLLYEPIEGKDLKVVLGRANNVPLKDAKSSPVSNITEDITSTTQIGLITISNGIGFLESGHILLNNEYMSYSSISATTINITGRGLFDTVATNHINGSTFFQKDAVFEYDVCRGPISALDTLQVLGTDNNYYDYPGDYTAVIDEDPVRVLFPDRKPLLERILVDGPLVPEIQYTRFNSYNNGEDVINPQYSIIAGGIFRMENKWSTQITGEIQTRCYPSLPGDCLPAERTNSYLGTPIFVGEVGTSPSEGSAMNIFPEYEGYDGLKTVSLVGSRIDLSEGNVVLSTTGILLNYQEDKVIDKIIHLGFLEAYAAYMHFEIFIDFAESFDEGDTWSVFRPLLSKEVDSLETYGTLDFEGEKYPINLYPDNAFENDSLIKLKFEVIVYEKLYPNSGYAKFKINTLDECSDAPYDNQGSLTKFSYANQVDIQKPQTKTFYLNYDKDLSYLGEFVDASIYFSTQSEVDTGYDSTTNIYYLNDEWILLFTKIYNDLEIVIFDEVLTDVTTLDILENFRLKFEYIPDSTAVQPESGVTKTSDIDIQAPRITINYKGSNLDTNNYQYADNLSVRCTGNLYPATPPALMKSLLSDNSKLAEYVDTTNFDARSDVYAYNNYYLNGLVDDNLYLHDALKLIMTEGLCRLRYNQGLFTCYDMYEYYDLSIDYSYSKNITLEQSRNQGVLDEKLANDIIINYDNDTLKKNYEGKYTVNDSTSIDENGIATFNKKYNLINTEDAAKEIADFILWQRGDNIFTGDFESFFHSFRIEKGDTLIVEYLGGYKIIKVQNVLRIFQNGTNNEMNIYKIEGIQRYILTMSDFNHNDLNNIQGGTEVDNTGYYHLTQDQFTKVKNNIDSLISHAADTTSNPHEVTKSQVGLGNVDNTSDLNKPISTATQAALDEKVDNTSFEGFQSDVTTLQEDVSELQSDMTIAQSDITQLETDVTSISEDVDILNDNSIYKLSIETLEGGIITANAVDSTSHIDISELKGHIIDHDDYEGASAVLITFGPYEHIELINLTTNDSTFISLDFTGGIIQEADKVLTSTDRVTRIPLGNVFHVGGIFRFASTRTNMGLDPTGELIQVADTLGALCKSGGLYSANGANVKVDLSAGEYYRYGINSNNRKLSSLKNVSAASPANLQGNYRDGTGGYITTLTSTDIDTNYYDDGSGTLAALPPNKYVMIYMFVAPGSGDTIYCYAQHTYNSMDDAIANIGKETVEHDPLLVSIVFRGYIVIKSQATDFSDSLQFRYFPVGKFAGSSGGSTVSGSSNFQSVYDNSFDVEIYLDNSKNNGGLTIADDSTPLAGNLFEVQNNSGSQKYLEVSSSETKVTGSTSDNTEYALKVNDSSDDELLSVRNDGNVYLGSDSVYNKENDYLGIGTTSPSTKVQITKDSTSVVNGASDTFLYLKDTGGNIINDFISIGFGQTSLIDTFGGMIGFRVSGNYSRGGLEFWTKNTASAGQPNIKALDIDSGGNSTFYADVVVGQDLFSEFIYGGSGSGDDLNLYSTSNATKGVINIGDFATFNESNNRLGINASYPGISLDVNGRIRNIATTEAAPSSGKGFETFYSTVLDVAALVSVDRDTNDLYNIESFGKDIKFLTGTNLANDTERMRITSNGDVGIGEDTPAARTHIKGSTSDSSAVALKVDDSSDSELFSIRNDGLSTFSGVTVQGTFSSAPTGVEGGIYYNSTDNHFYGHNGTSLVQLDN